VKIAVAVAVAVHGTGITAQMTAQKQAGDAINKPYAHQPQVRDIHRLQLLPSGI